VPLVLFALVAAAVLLAAPAFLSTAMRQADAQRARLEVREGNLVAEQAALRAKAATLTAGPRIKAEAKKLGMAPAETVHYMTAPPAGEDGGNVAASEGAATDTDGR
jgi:hypothetical protein